MDMTTVPFPLFISDFQVKRPRYESTQEDIAKWLIAAHVEAQSTNAALGEKEVLKRQISELLERVGCKSHAINSRGHVIQDLLHTRWDEMSVYRLYEIPQGVGLQKRQEIHASISDALFNEIYSTGSRENSIAPNNLLHVSCTGYSAPSSAQKLVSNKGWGHQATVTHVYHMGCYAAVPAVRIASSLIGMKSGRSDIVHTEFCSLHMNPLMHTQDQLVVQSLFADGCIKYSVVSEDMARDRSSLKILTTLERIIPESQDALTWHMCDWGFSCFLSKDIPKIIVRHLMSFIDQLSQEAGLSVVELKEQAIWAIHPGGPKIIDSLQRIFQLRDDQVQVSRDILYRYGNMSSATLPHIWESLCSDPSIPSSTKIISLAFGPGLTMAGIILEKR